MRVILFLLMGGLLINAPAQAQLTLPDVITLALNQSVAGQQAATGRELASWQLRRYRADFRPQVGLRGTLPDFSRAITPVVQPDGTTEFRGVRLNNSTLSLAVTQNIGLTGGQLYVASDLQRFDDFNGRLRRYNTQPFAVGITQPLRGFNALAWARRTEPVRYQEGQRQATADRAAVAQRTTELFFDVLVQQQQVALADQNARVAGEMLRLGREKLRLGRASEADLLLLELNQLNALQDREQAELAAQTARLALQTYVGGDRTATSSTAPSAGAPATPSAGAPLADALTTLLVPPPAPTPALTPADALAQARQRRPEVVAYQRRLLLADRDVAQARFSGGLQASLSANLGFINRAETLRDSYIRPQDQQQVRLTFSMPLLDWGRQRATVRVAELNRDLVRRAVAQDELTFEQTVLTQAAQLPTLGQQQTRAARADSLAQRRYAITQEVYKVGRLSLTDLSLAQQAKDAARLSLISALRAAWVGYYRLQALTLYDFERQQEL